MLFRSRCVEDLREAFSARDVSVKVVARGEAANNVQVLKPAVSAMRFKPVKGGRKAKAA